MTDWSEQARSLTETFVEAQQKMWEGWLGVARSFAAPGAAGSAGGAPAGEEAGPAPAAWAWDSWPAAWQDLGRATLAVWTRGSAGVPREVVDRVFAGQEAYLRFVDLALGSLRVVAPKIDTGEDWVELLRRYLDQLKEEMAAGSSWLTPEGVGAAAASAPELWRLYQTELRQLLGPWSGFLQALPADLTDLAAGDRNALSRLQIDFMEAFESAFGRYLAAPAIGYSRELQEKTFRGFEAWWDFRRAAQEFQTEVVNTGFAAYQDLLRELVERGEKGEAITSFRELFDLWTEMGERAYAGLFSTEGFAKIQGRFVNAANLYQIRQREVLEELQGLAGTPTRSEIDQVHKHVHDLRIEVRYMKRELAALRQEAEVAAGAPAGTVSAPAAAPPVEAAAKASRSSASKPRRKKTAEAAAGE